MNDAETVPPPAKKRRFFSDPSPEPEDLEAVSLPAPPDRDDTGIGSEKNNQVYGRVIPQATAGFDAATLEAVVAEKLDAETIRRLRHASGDNMERAINMYFDGSWRDLQQSAPESSQPVPSSSLLSSPITGRNISTPQNVTRSSAPLSSPVQSSSRPRGMMPHSRYIGAFGVEAWATRSGMTLLKPGDKVRIERQKIQPKQPMAKRGGKAKAGAPAARPGPISKRVDIVVRFTNLRGDEVGRLPQETAAWVSTLLDQKICRFEGICVFCPDRIRVNDTVYLQLRSLLLKTAFDSGAFKLQDNNRITGIFEAKETDEEKNLRLRQVALVRLFTEVNLHPSRTNDAVEKHKRQGLLRAAEIAERPGHNEEPNHAKTEPGTLTPPSDDAEDGAELEQNQLDTLYKKAQSFDFDTPAVEPAETFAMDLRHYQKQALYWMMGKEKNEKMENKGPSMHPLWEEYDWPSKDVDDVVLEEIVGLNHFYVNPYSGELSIEFPVQEQNCLGGILADEMGLGKTIEMLSLMHTHKSEVALSASESSMSSVNNLPRLPRNSSSVEKAPCTTLVVAPMSLLAQWQSEAENASKPGTMKTLVYYGSDKIGNLQALCCEANAASAPNLVITSYGVVLSEFNQVASNNGHRGSHGGLFSLDFFRVILDEAHHIKNRQSKTAKACYEISAQHRWVLTGTPIVNRLEDLFSLVRFLKVEPWSNFSYWKTFITVPFESKEFVRALDVVQTVLEPIVLRRTKDMKTPSGEALVPLPPKTVVIEEIELSKAEREIYDHIYTMAKQTFAVNVAAGTLLKSYTTIFAQILRLRQSCDHPLLVRNKNIVAEEEDAAAAADAANGLSDDMDLQELIQRFESDDNNNEQNVNNKYGAHVLKQIQEECDNECPICSEDPMIDQSVTGCWHSACKNCLLEYIEHQKEKGEKGDKIPRCFNCREVIHERDIFEVIKHDTEDDLYENSNGPNLSLRRIHSHSSAKTTALISHLKRLRQENRAMKSVVFSQFTSFLDLIEPALRREHIKFLRFDGSMPQKQRASVLSEFAGSNNTSNNVGNTGGGTTVLLLSLRAGGVGLNLTHAKRVFMMDPWWSFAVESQAIDRVHRMGQDEEVLVYRFIIKDSVEQRMLKIQERKKFIASSLGMMTDDEKRLQTIQDIKDLLS